MPIDQKCLKQRSICWLDLAVSIVNVLEYTFGWSSFKINQKTVSRLVEEIELQIVPLANMLARLSCMQSVLEYTYAWTQLFAELKCCKTYGWTQLYGELMYWRIHMAGLRHIQNFSASRWVQSKVAQNKGCRGPLDTSKGGVTILFLSLFVYLWLDLAVFRVAKQNSGFLGFPLGLEQSCIE